MVCWYKANLVPIDPCIKLIFLLIFSRDWPIEEIWTTKGWTPCFYYFFFSPQTDHIVFLLQVLVLFIFVIFFHFFLFCLCSFFSTSSTFRATFPALSFALSLSLSLCLFFFIVMFSFWCCLFVCLNCFMCVHACAVITTTDHFDLSC